MPDYTLNENFFLIFRFFYKTLKAAVLKKFKFETYSKKIVKIIFFLFHMTISEDKYFYYKVK